MSKYNVAIIGMGPAGLFAIKTILEQNSCISVLVLEQGTDTTHRKCPADTGTCQQCAHCAIVSGAGGAGMFSDGKLVLDLNFGGNSRHIEQLSPDKKKELCNNIQETLKKYDGVSEFNSLPNYDEREAISRRFRERDLNIKFYPVLHMGTQNLGNITKNFVNALTNRYSDRLTILYESKVQAIEKKSNGFVIRDKGGRTFESTYVITAVGKNGAGWNKKILQPLGCHFIANRAYYGVRVEVPAESMQSLLTRTFDPKIFRMYNDGSKMKIHCVCKEGRIRMYRYRKNVLVGGHSPYTEFNASIEKYSMSNFNVLLSCDKKDTDLSAMLQEFHDTAPLKMLVQSYEDFKNNTVTCSTNVSEDTIMQRGNIRHILEKYGDFAGKFVQFMSDLAGICPGIEGEKTLLYGPVMEWTMDKMVLKNCFETECANLFAVGDGAGISQGIVYAGATGILAAAEICRRFENEAGESVLSGGCPGTSKEDFGENVSSPHT